MKFNTYDGKPPLEIQARIIKLVTGEEARSDEAIDFLQKWLVPETRKDKLFIESFEKFRTKDAT